MGTRKCYRLQKTIKVSTILQMLRAAGTLLTFDDPNCAAFEKTFGTEKILVIANTRSISKIFNVPTALQNTTWINEMDGSSITLSATFTLNPTSFSYWEIKLICHVSIVV
jgi:hypothetical protein